MRVGLVCNITIKAVIERVETVFSPTAYESANLQTTKSQITKSIVRHFFVKNSVEFTNAHTVYTVTAARANAQNTLE